MFWNLHNLHSYIYSRKKCLEWPQWISSTFKQSPWSSKGMTSRDDVYMCGVKSDARLSDQEIYSSQCNQLPVTNYSYTLIMDNISESPHIWSTGAIIHHLPWPVSVVLAWIIAIPFSHWSKQSQELYLWNVLVLFCVFDNCAHRS